MTKLSLPNILLCMIGYHLLNRIAKDGSAVKKNISYDLRDQMNELKHFILDLHLLIHVKAVPKFHKIVSPWFLNFIFCQFVVTWYFKAYLGAYQSTFYFAQKFLWSISGGFSTVDRIKVKNDCISTLNIG